MTHVGKVHPCARMLWPSAISVRNVTFAWNLSYPVLVGALMSNDNKHSMVAKETSSIKNMNKAGKSNKRLIHQRVV